MSISLDQTHNSPGNSQAPSQPTRRSASTWCVPAFWGTVLLLLVAAVLMRLYHLDLPFDRDSYDEGVYWQSLRSMLAGQSLYNQIFYSQPPLFLLSTYPGFALFGGSLWSARFGIVLVSLLGFPGAFLLGKTLAGRVGALVAMLLLLIDPLYLMQSQLFQAEASSVAFTLLTIAFAFLWYAHPEGRRGMYWAALCGLTFALSVLCKLWPSALVPIALLMLARGRQIVRKEPGTSRQSWWPMLVGIGVALLVLVVTIVPFAGSFKDFWASIWTFHIAAGKVAAMSGRFNLTRIYTGLLSVTTLAAFYGAAVALLRRDWRVLPILAWLLVTLVMLYRQQPLFIHHLVELEPPLITLALLGLARPEAYRAVLSKYPVHVDRSAHLLSGVAIFLLAAAVVGGAVQDVIYYQAADAQGAGSITQQMGQAANDLRQATKPGDWVITDSQFVAALADRSTPPWLVDTSTVRLQTGYITVAQLEQAAMNPRVHAVLFYTGRLYYIHQAIGFHAWVTTHFHLLRKYQAGQELWVR